MNINKTILILSLLAAAAPARAQVVADSGAFFVRLGKDTVAVERYIRTKESLVAEAALRTPQTRAYKLTLTLRDDGGVSWYELLNNPVAGVPKSAPVMRSVTTYGADSATIQAWYAAQPFPPRKVAATPGMIPLQLPFYSTVEMALQRVRSNEADPVRMTMLSAAGPLSYLVKFGPADSVTLVQPGAGITRARMDAKGRLLDLNGEGTTFKVIVTRAKWADLDAYLKRYAAAEAEGKGMGGLSPRDSIAGMIDGEAEIMLAYGRPSKRGRVTFGGVVPWGEVWRTGANEATSILFIDTVEVAGVTVPKGKYTLWTVPGKTGWQLIINKQTGQWGTTYDPKQDLVRIPVKSETVSVPVEKFTIEFKPTPLKSNLMTLTWDRVRVLVPMRKKGTSSGK